MDGLRLRTYVEGNEVDGDDDEASKAHEDMNVLLPETPIHVDVRASQQDDELYLK